MGKTVGATVIDTEACKGCGLCVEACPQNILEIKVSRVNRKGYPYVEVTDGERCTGCAACGIVCPDSCITVYRMKTDVKTQENG